VGQFLEVERQRVRWDPEPLGHRARRQAGSASNDKRAEDLQADGLGERRKRLNDVSLFHDSTLFEQWNLCQVATAGGQANSKSSDRNSKLSEFRPVNESAGGP